MIVLHPNSVCDVCLEVYGDSNAPHAITCGHTFCLRCLKSLTKQWCPLCRTSFSVEDVRKLHIDRCNTDLRARTPPLPDDDDDDDDGTCPVRTLRGRITRIVLDGAKASEVRDFIDEVRGWLSTQPAVEHADLRAAYLLLFKYTDLQYKVKEEKAVIAELQQHCEDLKEKIHAERELADVKYQELSQKRMDEMETAMAVERNLRERFDRMDKDWREKVSRSLRKCGYWTNSNTINLQYDDCIAECRRLNEELKQGGRHNVPSSRPSDSRFLYSADRDSSNTECMAVTEEEEAESRDQISSPRSKEDRFQLSPIPATATLPVSHLPNRQNFRPLTAEESDVEDFKSKRNSPYLLRSIEPIPIRPGVQRMNSNSSLLSRPDADGVPRSLPRSLIDVHMASCSSSPTAAFQYSSRDRERFDDSMSMQDNMQSYRNGGVSRRTSLSSHIHPREHDELQERARTLNRVLDKADTSKDAPVRIFDRRERQRSPDTSAPTTRTPSPVSAGNSQMGPPLSKPQVYSPLLQPPPQQTVSWASAAALQAERARANSIKDSPSSPTSLSPTSPVKPDRTRDYGRDTSAHSVTPSQQYQPRRPSLGSMRAKSSSNASVPSAASGLTRSFWGMQEPQRV